MGSASPGNRLQTGTAVLAAARGVDTRLIGARLKGFERAHKLYVDAQRKVEAAEAELRAAQAVLGERDVDQDEAVEALARALVGEGYPRANPFASFDAASPAAIMRLPFGEETMAIRQLVSGVQRNKQLARPTLNAAQAAEKAARVVDQALTPIPKLETVLKETRHTRDAVGQAWETALAALKRGARAAADDGAPRLYMTLFSRPPRGSNTKEPTAPRAPQSTAAPVRTA